MKRSKYLCVYAPTGCAVCMITQAELTKLTGITRSGIISVNNHPKKKGIHGSGYVIKQVDEYTSRYVIDKQINKQIEDDEGNTWEEEDREYYNFKSLSIDEICKKLGISKDKFRYLVKTGTTSKEGMAIAEVENEPVVHLLSEQMTSHAMAELKAAKESRGVGGKIK